MNATAYAKEEDYSVKSSSPSLPDAALGRLISSTSNVMMIEKAASLRSSRQRVSGRSEHALFADTLLRLFVR
jgi:hypothetical protein